MDREEHLTGAAFIITGLIRAVGKVVLRSF
jgi:hypothetical protein